MRLLLRRAAPALQAPRSARRLARRLLVPLLVAAAATACAGAPGQAPEEPAADLVRTADPRARGLSEDDFPRLQELAPGVYSYEQLRSAGVELFTTVSFFVITSEGVLVADGQGSVEETRRLVETIATLTDQPITHVVICSDHGDHTAGNAAFPGDARFLAHPTSAAALTAAAARNPDAAPVVMPTEMVDEQRVLDLGGREIRVLFLGRAHTGGDLHVYLPAERILFMSEAFMNRVFPATRSAYPSEWVTVLERAEQLDVDIYVPGHGFVDPPAILRQELRTYRQALEQVIAETTRVHATGVSLEEAIDAADFGELEGWSLRDSQRPLAIRRVYAELDGELARRE